MVVCPESKKKPNQLKLIQEDKSLSLNLSPQCFYVVLSRPVIPPW